MPNINLPVQAPWVAQIQDIFSQYWWLLLILVIWSITWKGLALWKAARNDSTGWFILILVVNTVGILEIIYIFAVARAKQITNTQA